MAQETKKKKKKHQLKQCFDVLPLIPKTIKLAYGGGIIFFT
jgi:hypothetical protein